MRPITYAQKNLSVAGLTAYLAYQYHLCFCILCFSWFRVCSLLPCGHLLGKGWPLGSCWWCLLYFRYFPMWYPGSGGVLDCIVSWSLPSVLIWSSVCEDSYICRQLEIERSWLHSCGNIWIRTSKLFHFVNGCLIQKGVLGHIMPFISITPTKINIGIRQNT